MHLTCLELKMVAMRTLMLRFALIFLLMFIIQGPSFMTSNSVCNNFHAEEVNGNAATFIYESL